MLLSELGQGQERLADALSNGDGERGGVCWQVAGITVVVTSAV